MLCRGCGNEINVIEYCSNCNDMRLFTGDAETAIGKVKNPYIPINTTISESKIAVSIGGSFSRDK
jgi:methylaspartate ammonia-lyase